MRQLSRDDYQDLRRDATPTGQSVALSRGVQGTQSDERLLLNDGSLIELVCRHGWIYEYRRYTASEVAEARTYVPYALAKGWCER